MRVEVQQGHRSVPFRRGAQERECDGVVTAQGDQAGTAGREVERGGLDGVQRLADVEGVDRDVARVRDLGGREGRLYGETGQGDNSKAQFDADRGIWPIADRRRAHVKAMVYVVDGVVKRIRAIDAKGKWEPVGNRWEFPVTEALEPAEIVERFPSLGFTLGDPMPGQRGKMREYIALYFSGMFHRGGDDRTCQASPSQVRGDDDSSQAGRLQMISADRHGHHGQPGVRHQAVLGPDAEVVVFGPPGQAELRDVEGITGRPADLVQVGLRVAAEPDRWRWRGSRRRARLLNDP